MSAKQLYLLSLFASILIAIAYGPIEQPQSYHNFADNREFLSIPNTLDVMSNIVIVFPGIMGLLLVKERSQKSLLSEDEISIHITLFSGMILTFAGSVWFHLDPNDSTLFWDRLGMSVVIGSCISLLIHDMWDRNIVAKIHIPILVLSILSVVSWTIFDDLRFYFIIKHHPFVLLPILMYFSQSIYDNVSGYIKGLSMFVLATIFEFTDLRIFELTGFISGHTMKHIFAGIGLWFLMVMIRDRELRTYEEE